MDSKEEQLEEISERVNNYKPVRNLPLFEHFVTMTSIALSVLFFLSPTLLVEGQSDSYFFLLSIMPQTAWAFTFFLAAMVKTVGLLVDNNVVRIIGLLMSALIYGLFSFSYGIIFPNIGTVIFILVTLFSIISIPEVKKTGLRE